MERLFAIVALVFQFGDYLVKAATGYAQTEQGAKEWDDVERALVDVGLLDTAIMADGSSYPADVPTWVSEADINNGWGGIGQMRNAPPITEIPAVPLNARQRAAQEEGANG